MKEREESTDSMNAKFMCMDSVISQLSSLRDNSADMAKDPEADRIWTNDVDALEAAIAMLSVLRDEGVTDAEGVKDLIHDYNGLVRQSREAHRKYETTAKAIRRDGVWHCPECNHRVAPKHSHCHWCGKKLGGW